MRRSRCRICLALPGPGGTAKNWAAYRSRFVEPRRLDAGVRFWREHAAVLERAQTDYGVPAWLVVGIIGVETLYGQHTGNYRVLDALTTLAFDFPASHPRAAQRTEFFRAELDAFCAWPEARRASRWSWRGSYAGAMGLPQFMPSNWGRLAWTSTATAASTCSTARPTRSARWPVTCRPTAGNRHADPLPGGFDESTLDMETLLAPDILPSFSVPRLQPKACG
jgi:membrane-bound lytic murein transglycosylase B